LLIGQRVIILLGIIKNKYLEWDSTLNPQEELFMFLPIFPRGTTPYIPVFCYVNNIDWDHVHLVKKFIMSVSLVLFLIRETVLKQFLGINHSLLTSQDFINYWSIGLIELF
jgi:hypothetical protein